MATPARYCPSCLSSLRTAKPLKLRPSLTPFNPSIFTKTNLTSQQSRTAVQSANALKYRRKDQQSATKKNKKKRSHFLQPDLKDARQFSLVDAMRYLRAAEVGRAPTSAKYELHIRLRTPKNGQIVRSRLRLPHPVRTDLRIAVICPPDSDYAKTALSLGASVAGEETIFEAVKDGRIEFERCICQTDSLPKLAKSGIARILGPRGLMPSAKLGTVVKDVGSTVRDMVGGSEYRERMGVVRMAVGQLGFTPEEMQKNIKAFIDRVKKDMAALSDVISKDIHEVVLSSTHGPGMSLDGTLRSESSPPERDVSTLA